MRRACTPALIFFYADVDPRAQAAHFLNTVKGHDLGLPLWLAKYTSAAQPHTLPTGWASWSFWKYTSSGSVPGVSRSVDLDHSTGSSADLQTWIANN